MWRRLTLGEYLSNPGLAVAIYGANVTQFHFLAVPIQENFDCEF